MKPRMESIVRRVVGRPTNSITTTIITKAFLSSSLLFLLLLLLFLSSHATTAVAATIRPSEAILLEAGSYSEEEEESYFRACVEGQMDILDSLLKRHGVGWVHHKTKDGEHGLHLAAIKGQTSVTRFLLENGADPDVRSSYSGGLCMHPLSWNVYGGHDGNVKLLLEYGADINADFDGSPPPSSSESSSGSSIVTVMDISTKIMETTSKKKSAAKNDDEQETTATDSSDSFQRTYELLLKYGAKRYQDLPK